MLLLLVLSACRTERCLCSWGPAGGPPEPRLEVDPPSLEFPRLLLGEEATRAFEISNLGDARLTVASVRAAGIAFSMEWAQDPRFSLVPGTAISCR